MTNSFKPSTRSALPRPSILLAPGKRHRADDSLLRSRSLLFETESRRPAGHQTVWEILQQPLVKCPVVSHAPSGRSPNKTAQEAGYHAVKITYKNWNDAFPPTFDHLYRSLEHSSVWIPRRAQDKRVIRSEGDVADFTLTNVVLPVTDILNSLIHRELKDDLIIVPAHECALTIEIPTKDALGMDAVADRSISLDHTLVLINRRAYEQNWTTNAEIYLVVVEEKRIPCVNPTEWNDEAFTRKEPNSMRDHLPQLLMYAEHFKTSQLLLTDSRRYVAVNARVIPPRARGRKKEATIAYHRGERLAPPTRDDRHPFDPFFSGQRHSLCALGIEALRSHGILDDKILSISPELNPFRPRQYSLREIILTLSIAHRTSHIIKVVMRETYKILDQIPCGKNQSLIAAYFEPDRVETRRQYRADEPVPHPLPPRWSHL
ncbi:hypothetical protein JCM5353_001614 [Sporobolomyces roseus]